jgi:hypothetical protein
LLYYNQWTLNSKPLGIFLKILPFAIPEVIIETIAERKSNLITWKKGWNWYHSFGGGKTILGKANIPWIQDSNLQGNYQ